MTVLYNVETPWHAYYDPRERTVDWFRSLRLAEHAARKFAREADGDDHDFYGDHTSVRRYELPRGSRNNLLTWALNRGECAFGVEVSRFALGTGKRVHGFKPHQETGKHELSRLNRTGGRMI